MNFLLLALQEISYSSPDIDKVFLSIVKLSPDTLKPGDDFGGVVEKIVCLSETLITNQE